MALHLEIRHLNLIKAVAEAGTITRASESLHLTQSALSHQLRDVERKLDAALFLRLKKRMILTPAGELLLRSAERVLSEMAEVERGVRHLNSKTGGVIRLSTECYTCYHWLPRLLAKFSETFPGVRIEIAVDATRNALQALLAGKIDVAITDAAITDANLIVQKLFEDEMVAVVSPAHRFAARQFLRPEDFADEHLFTYSAPSKNLSIIQNFLAPHNVAPKRHSQIELTEAIVEMVKANLGIAVLANWAVRSHVEARTLRAVKLTKKGFPRQWKAIARKPPTNQPAPVYLVDFIEVLSQHPFGG